MTPASNSRLVNLAAFLLTGTLSVYIMVQAHTLLVPLVWALFLSVMILPPVRWLENRKVPRPLAIVSVLGLVILFMLAVLYMLSVQVAGLVGDLPGLAGRFEAWMVDLQEMLQAQTGASREVITRQLSDSVVGLVDSGLAQLRNSLFSIFRTVTLITIIPLYVFLMLYYRDLFYGAVLSIVKDHPNEARRMVNRISRLLQKYLSGMVLVTFIMAVLFYVVLLLIGLEYALFFAIFLAVFNLIPYVGVVIASGVVLVYTIATFSTPLVPVVLLLALWGIQLLENNLLTPYILGKRVHLNPMIALIAILAGASIWGISGMILFIPMAGALRVIFEEIEGLKPYALLLGGSPDEEN